MKHIYHIVSLLSCLSLLFFGSCKKKPVAPKPVLEGQWRADSLHTASYSSTNVLGPVSTLLAAPNTTLTFSATTLTDRGSLGLGGSSTNPVTYNYTRNGTSIILSHPTVAIQYTGVVKKLTDNRLQLEFIRPAALGGSLIYTEAFYSK
jgi:hypothetical protein